MAIIKKSTNNKYWREYGEKGTLPPKLLVGMEIGAVTMENSIEILFRKLKIELPYYPAVLLLGICPDKTIIQKRYMHSCVHSSTIHNNQDMKIA